MNQPPIGQDLRARRDGRALQLLLAATAVIAAILAALAADVAPRVAALAGDASATLSIGSLTYCPTIGDPCCNAPAEWSCLQPVAAAAGSGLALRRAGQWLAVDMLFAVLYGLLVALAARSAMSVFGWPARLGNGLAAIALAAAASDLVENGALLVVLRSLGDAAAPAYAVAAQTVASVVGYGKWAILLPLAVLAVGLVGRRFDLIRDHLGYFAVLRPTVVFTAVLLYLPVSAIPTAPLSSMLGNLLVDYDFRRAFWLGLTLFPLIWSVMFTACLLLDSERKRDGHWIHDPGPGLRTVTLPIRDPWIFIAFTAIAIPTIAVVTWTALGWADALAGLLAGGLLAYLGLDLSLSILRLGGANWPTLPWEPLVARVMPTGVTEACIRLSYRVRGAATWIMRRLQMPNSMFTDTGVLEDDHVFAVWSLLVMFGGYALLSLGLWWAVHTDRFDVLYALPPAGFLYVMLIWLVWLLTPIWFLLRRYRLALGALVVGGLVLYALSGSRGATYTFDARPIPSTPLAVAEVLGGKAVSSAADPTAATDGTDDPIIIVAASGGGIAAAGWTAKVLSELHERIPDFGRRLRLLSTVSGGSVGSAHYLHMLDRTAGKPDAAALAEMIALSMDTSLSTTAYAFAFPELQRTLFAMLSGPDSDRGRLQERNWHWRATCGTLQPARQLADFRADVIAGRRPAVIFNTTLMETGGRVAVTNLEPFAPAPRDGPTRLCGPRTLSDLLNDGSPGPFWSVDPWTAARLSATFSYVSPAATIEDVATPSGTPIPAAARRHLIDGGYHDNFGVASALDWLRHAGQVSKGVKDRKIALVEIRASPQAESTTPADGLTAEWLGPVVGMWSSWWRSQTETNDTAVDLLEASSEWKFRSFVFVPSHEPPLSWHLSHRQQERICAAWSAPGQYGNEQQLRELRDWLEGIPPDGTRDYGTEVVDCATLPVPCESPRPTPTATLPSSRAGLRSGG